MVLVMAVRFEPGHVIGGLDLDQAPVIGVKLTLSLEFFDAVSDVANFGHSVHL